MSEVTLLSALECIQSSLAKTRIKGFQDLRYILRHNQNSSKVSGLDDASFHSIFETLFHAAVGEQSQVAKAKTSATQRSASGRLSELASALRHAVDVGAPFIKAKTARAVLDHVADTIQLPNGSFCEPIAVDYAKCMRTILSHQPHVEHMNRSSTKDRNDNEWERIADFCARCIQEVTAQSGADEFPAENGLTSTAGHANTSSYRSSRSAHRDSGGSQVHSSAVRTVVDEMIGCLRALTAAPNAPLQKKAEPLLWLLIEYLRTTIPTPRSPDDAFAAVNQLLCWTRTEDTKLTQDITVRLVRLVKDYWTAKSPALNQMTITILLLRPYIFHAMSQDEGVALRAELSGLLQAIQGEYSQRQDREQAKQLSLEDIRLEINVTRSLEDGKVGIPLFTLQPSEARSNSESSWALTYILASLTAALMGADKLDHELDSSHDDREANGQRPSKRRRRDFDDQSEDFAVLLKGTTSGSTQARICSLQTLAFLAQQRALDTVEIGRTIDALMVSCADDVSAVASWAYLAFASCASQTSATSPKLTSKWTSLWQLASRALSNVNLCRSASFALFIMLRLRLVAHSSINDLVQIATNAMDLNGPAQISDAVTLLLRSVLNYSRQTNPEASSATAESILTWLSRTFTPSKLDDKQYTAGTVAYEVSDLVPLIDTVLNRQGHTLTSSNFPVWHIVARAWLFCEGQRELISYLLLNDEVDPRTNAALDEPMQQTAAAAPEVTRTSCEAILLTHLLAELTRANEAWATLVTERTRQPSHDTFAMLCKACCIVVCISSCVEFRDSRRSLQVRTQSENLLRSLGEYIARPESEQTKVDRFLTTFSAVFSGLARLGALCEYHRLPCEVLVCHAISKTLDTRQEATQFGDHNDPMELDDDLEDSQDSRQPSPAVDTSQLANDLDVAYSKLALRSSAALYATTIVALETRDEAMSDRSPASEQVVGFLLKQPETAVIASRSIITQFNRLGLVLALPDVQHLLEFFVDTIFPSYTYGRSEVAIGTFLDVMHCLIDTWTDPSNTDLHNLGLDVYDWCTATALPNGVLSPIVQKRLATLLVQLCRLLVDYPSSDGDASYAQDSSARTSLFILLKQGAVTVQFHLAESITKVFGRTVLSKHEPMFQDLVESLPEDIDKVEGIAMRLLFFAKLGSEWHSLLRQCVYYIFETAGTGSVSHAAHCIEVLASQLPLQTPRKLFTLFAPQLLFTWLSSDKSLREIPFAAFQYNSLNELLVENQTEVCAQVIMLGSEDGINMLSKALKVLPKGVITHSFAKSVAYAISCDIKTASTKGFTGDSVAVEHRLRSLIGGEVEHRDNIRKLWPAIIGYFFLTTQQEDAEDKWLETKPPEKQNYEPDSAVMLSALKKIKAFSHSKRRLPQSQEPSFRTSDLGREVGRLCKRLKFELGTLWDSSSFTLVVRMLLDAMDESLGSLHSCLMIRRLRILVCMAGEVAFRGFPLEMLIHSLRPFLNDSECADDALGVVQYLFNNSREHFRKHMPFLCGTVTLLVLQLRKYAKSSHNSTTQESQHSATVQKMLGFQKWLVEYLSKRASDCDSTAYQDLVKALSSLQLPGNARRDSPESALLLFLLTQWSAKEPLCTRTDCLEAIGMLAEGFESTTFIGEDCLGKDADAALYFQSLWDVMLQAPLPLGFTQWSARVVGRAYASTGQRPHNAPEQKHISSERYSHVVQDGQVTANSQAIIARRWVGLLLSRSRTEAGLAEHSLRKLDESPDQSATDTSVFAQALPCEVNDAVSSGCYSYEPLSASQRDFTAVDDDALRSALQIPAARSLEVWTRELAVTVCRWASSVAIVGCLGPLMRNVSSLSAELLPSMLHILLVEEMNRHRTLRFELSAAITACLADTDPALQDKQQFLLNLVLYLRSQPYPGESTRADRVQWLEVDYALAASAAARCGMPHCGLLLAESIIPVGQSRRASGRASLSQAQPVSAFENGLLLSLFRQMEEPDSFYGIQQPASLDTVLSRLDHEANGLRSLMFRSAQTDSRMRHSHRLAEEDAVGMIHSLSKLNFNSLAFALLNHGMGSGPKTSESMLDAAKALQQWDIDLPETRIGDAFTSFGILQELNRAADPRRVHEALCLAVAEHAQRGTFTGKSTRPSLSWCGVLASLTELEAIVSSSDLEEMATRWQAIQDGSSWMHMARYEDVRALLSNRETLFGVLSQNLELQRALHMGQRDARKFEVQALLEKSKLARGHGRLQEALTATATLSELIVLCSDNDLKVEGVVKLETATVLWDAGEASTSVKMLRDVLEMTDLGKQDLLVGRAGLRAQLAHQLAEARLEKPEDILRQYLKPAISELKTVKTGAEAGKVFFEFAKFCDDELQNPGNIENFNRVVKLRHGKQEEVDAIKAAIDKARRNGTDRSDLHRTLGQETKWLDMDTTEEKRLRDSRSVYVQQSLQNYLLALQASDEHDICVLRFFALWLEHSDDDRANSVVQKYLKDVPSWKFVLLMNQLMSRVSNEPSIFQAALGELMVRIFKQHPYHSLHHLFTNAKNQPKSNDPATRSRYLGSLAFVERLNRNPTRKDAIYRLFACNRLYRELADSTPEPNKAGRFKLDDIPAAKKLRALVSKTLQPPITISLPLRSDGNYDNVPLVQRFEDNGLILGGVSAPKLIAVIDDTGKKYKQIFKNGRDDLRQDAIMEQVFEEVSKMLRNHKSTRQRDLKVRTYKVIPLSNTTGVIEFVPNSMPLMDFLRPAHLRYHPKDIKENKAREIINGVKDAPQRERVAQYRKVCEQMQPVLRHFFLERYDNPDEWFTKRTAYTRTTASVSILGHIIGLGDRHCSNILIDEMTGEIVHIDLGVSFEAGKVLPIPELVPFRLTRDIIDGMGITKTEGVFRRCCEFTLDAVREDKDSIMTLLNVLRYDPLYNWTVSPLKAKRMQQAQDTGRHAADEMEPSTSKRNEDGGESERSLQIVEKKLSKTLSTAATVNELIQQATDESHLACLFSGWGAYY